MQPLHSKEESSWACDRRLLMGMAAGAIMLQAGPSPSMAFQTPPAGFRLQLDKLDGYSFLYPESWTVVTISGNDIFVRNPRNIDENLFVEITSPSSSRYETVADYAPTADAAAAKLLDQVLV